MEHFEAAIDDNTVERKGPFKTRKLDRVGSPCLGIFGPQRLLIIIIRYFIALTASMDRSWNVGI